MTAGRVVFGTNQRLALRFVELLQHKAAQFFSGEFAMLQIGGSHHDWLEGRSRERLCMQRKRVVAHDYTVRHDGKLYQLMPPALPGLRGGAVIVENGATEACVCGLRTST